MDILELQHDTTRPYKVVDYKGIEYTVCRNYNHISRYKRLRKVMHYLAKNNKKNGLTLFTTLEVQNSYDYNNIKVEYYQVPITRENRLDLISYDFYGTTSYSWIIAYINRIYDGYTVYEGQVLMMPTELSELFASNCVLSSIPPTSLNLGTE